MSIEHLKNELKAGAQNCGLCVPWQQMLDDAADRETLVRMFIRGIDFYLLNDYPSASFIDTHFKGMCEKHGVFVNELIGLAASAPELRRIIAVGHCSGEISLSGFSVSQLFVKHTSRLVLSVRENAIVTLECFDNSITDVMAADNAEISIYRYAGAIVNITGTGYHSKVTITDRDRKTI